MDGMNGEMENRATTSISSSRLVEYFVYHLVWFPEQYSGCLVLEVYTTVLRRGHASHLQVLFAAVDHLLDEPG